MRPPARPKFDVIQVLFFCLAAWLVFNIIQTTSYIWADYPQIPVEEYWRIPQLWADVHTIHWSNLWVQHNEHRIIFPELVYIADMLFLKGRMYLPIAFSGACYFSVWLMLAWIAYTEKILKSPERELGLLLAGIMITWKGCSSVIATPFQLAFTLNLFAATLSFFFLSKLAEEGKPKYLVRLIAAAIVGNYSIANGILLWPLLIAAALFLKIRIRKIALLSVSAILSAGAYFFQYHFLPSSIRANLQLPIQDLAFLCSYLSMPFGGSGAPSYGVKLGALNLIGMVVCSFLLWRKGLLRTRLSIALFGTYSFILASAILTSLGRMRPNDFPFIQAKAWRYVTMPTVSWALLAMAIVWLSGMRASRGGVIAATLMISAFFTYGFRKSSSWLEVTRTDAANAQITATMLRNNVVDPNQLHTIFPSPDFVNVYLPVLRSATKSIYSTGPEKWIGGDVLSLPTSQTPVAGQVTRVIPIAEGLEILGWADGVDLTADHEILFADERHQIVGFGRRPAAGLPFLFGAFDTPQKLAFVGFVSQPKPGAKLSVYAFTRHGRLVQPLGQPLKIPTFTLLTTNSDNPALANINWLPDPTWTPRGYQPGPEDGPAPATVAYGSWSGSDANTGVIQTGPFPTPSNNCLVLPVLHGTATYGQSVQVRDEDHNQIIASLPFIDGQSIWLRWRIPIPVGTSHVSIQASDQGSGLGQWLAIASPEQCTN